jgi:hypothetical protein
VGGVLAVGKALNNENELCKSQARQGHYIKVK